MTAVKIKGDIKNYDWGKIGNSSIVATLFYSDEPEKIHEKSHYAELWFGTHSKGMSTIDHSSVHLIDYVQHPLSYLFKVNVPLSIQVHPNLKKSQLLHSLYPLQFPDSNDKPEMCIALTPFRLLYGFRPYLEIINFIKENIEVQNILSKALHYDFSSSFDAFNSYSISSLFSTLMMSDISIRSEQITSFIHRISKSFIDKEPYSLIVSLYSRYTCHASVDISFIFINSNRFYLPCSSTLFHSHRVSALNLHEVTNSLLGESLFIRSNIPHCYLEGNCIEFMRSSDNVIRGGLTNKVIDINLFCESLDFSDGFPIINKGNVIENGLIRYSFPPPYSLSCYHILLNSALTVKLPPLHKAICLLYKGSGYVTIKDNNTFTIYLKTGYSFTRITHSFVGNALFIDSLNCSISTNEYIEAYICVEDIYKD